MCGKRISSLLGKITVLIIICCFCLPAHAKYGGGKGEPNDPYLIYDANQMNAIGADPNDWDKHFKLMADIDLSAYTGTSFNIIGTDDHNPFGGVFDGNGKKISNFTYTSTDIDYIGLFGFVGGEIKDLVLLDPNVDAGIERWAVGSLVGWNGGIITNCYAEGSNISGSGWAVGGLVGDNTGKISKCCSEGDVSGEEDVGGLVGLNTAIIYECYSSGSVSGESFVGGLVASNYGTITDCYSTSSIVGLYVVGGLVGDNMSGTIDNCYSTGSVSGQTTVGGLVGLNYVGTIANCYSEVVVSGNEYVGGLVGINFDETIINSYSTGSVMGYNSVGGLVGLNFDGTIINSYSTGSITGYNSAGGLVGLNIGGVTDSFWDIETSGQDWSDGGTGLSTAEMQTVSTFTDAGWDFVGETFNGIEDVWFIGQQGYPHLWWEGMRVPMKLTPRTLNCRSEGNWVKAHITLPQGVSVADVNSDRSAVLHYFGFQSAPLDVFVNKNKLVEIEAAFEREAVCSLTGDWPQMLTVVGFLADGNIFLGTSTVRIIHPGMKVIEDLASYWLNQDCVQPDFCDGIDMNRDSLVNLLDYALLLNSQVEFVTDE